MMATTGSTLTASHAALTAATPKMAPVERSKPPPMITSVRAQAMMKSGVDWLRMLSRLRGVRKDGDSSVEANQHHRDDDEHAILAHEAAPVERLAGAGLGESGVGHQLATS